MGGHTTVPAVQEQRTSSLLVGRVASDGSKELHQGTGIWLLLAPPQWVQESLHLPLLHFLFLTRHRKLPQSLRNRAHRAAKCSATMGQVQALWSLAAKYPTEGKQ